MTSYRNVRFGFQGSYGDAFVVFMILPIFAVFTLYMAMPWVLKKIDEYLYNNIYYGDKKLACQPYTSQYYITCLTVLGISFLAFFALAILIALFSFIIGLASFDSGSFSNISAGLISIFTMFCYLLVISVLTGIYKAQIRSHIYANSHFEHVATFKSTITASQYAQLLFINMIAIIFTLGLAYPWTAIRKAQLMASGTEISILEGADTVIDNLNNKQSVFAEEAAEIFDIDIALT